jgi:DNA-binding CsgD family transcriptional regulator
MVARSDLARRVPADDTELLAARIGELGDGERYLLALAAQGLTNLEIAYRVFRAQYSVHKDLRRIFKRLRGEEVKA